jgi:hypothetical protein
MHRISQAGRPKGTPITGNYLVDESRSLGDHCFVSVGTKMRSADSDLKLRPPPPTHTVV